MTTLSVIPLGMVNSYVLVSETCIMLVDVGTKKTLHKLLDGLDKLSIVPSSIDYILLTHYHEDHTGPIEEMIQATSAKLIMSQIEHDTWTEKIPHDITPVTPLGKFIYKIYDIIKRKEVMNPVDIDIFVDDHLDLKPLGISGHIYLTPGHTKGSLSLLLDNGEAIIGDHIMAMMPWSKPGLPIISYSLSETSKSIYRLIEKGAKNFYLSHGKNYDTSEILDCLKKFPN